MVPRILHLPFGRKSFFLFGPRQVGKSTLVKHALANRDHVEIDLLKSDVMLRYKTNPSLLRSEIEYLAQKKELGDSFRLDEVLLKGSLPPGAVSQERQEKACASSEILFL